MDVVTNEIELKANVGSDRSWVYQTAADMSEGEPARETLTIRFSNSDSTCSCRSLPAWAHLSGPRAACRCQRVQAKVPRGAGNQRPNQGGQGAGQWRQARGHKGGGGGRVKAGSRSLELNPSP